MSEFIVGSSPHLKETHVAFTCAYVTKTDIKPRKKNTKKYQFFQS